MAHNIKVAVLVSGFGSNLQVFIDGTHSGDLPISIVGVISNKKGAYGLERARKANIPEKCIPHDQFPDRQSFDRALLTQLKEWKAELVILAGFMRILGTEFVDQFENRLINIHPSLLPDYTGLDTHQQVLDADEKWHGASVHFVIPEFDAGPVIVRGRLEIDHDDTADSLQQRIHTIEHHIYPLAVKWFVEGRLSTSISGEVLLDGEQRDQQLITFP